MQDNKNQKADQQGAGQNPTLNEPGAQVADYGNPNGGSGNDNVRQGGEEGRVGDENSGRRSEGNETVGNP